jgi:hypothetical protein
MDLGSLRAVPTSRDRVVVERAEVASLKVLGLM